jgi:hypothetical protein
MSPHNPTRNMLLSAHHLSRVNPLTISSEFVTPALPTLLPPLPALLLSFPCRGSTRLCWKNRPWLAKSAAVWQLRGLVRLHGRWRRWRGAGYMLTTDGEVQGRPKFGFEGPDWRPERGEWMGADKKSCQEFGLCPKSLPKNLAHTCQDHVVTTDLLTLGTS